MRHIITYEQSFNPKTWGKEDVTIRDIKIIEFYIKYKFNLNAYIHFRDIYVSELTQEKKKFEIKLIFFHSVKIKNDENLEIFEKIKDYLKPERYLFDNQGIDDVFYYIISLERFLEIREDIELEKNMRKYNL
jgi:hypothetical protein